MKSIQQKCQLSDKKLKAVLRSEEMSLGEIIGQAIDYNAIHEEIKDIAKAVYDKLRVGFQVMLEKVISEEFMNFLSEIAESGGNCSRNGYYARMVRTFLGDFDLQIPMARYEQFQTKLLRKYGMTSATSIPR